MNIDSIRWQEFEPYLRKARGQSESSALNHKSRFKVLQDWFKGKNFDNRNFSIFLSYVEGLGLSASYQNNCLKLAKHLSHYLGEKDEFDGFKYINEGDSKPEVILSRTQINQLAEVKIKYLRYKDRKQKHEALIKFLGNVGSRRTETLLLEWRDLIPGDSPMVHFRAEVTKTKRERFCPIPQWLYQLLQKLPKENEFIFSKIDGVNFANDLNLRRQKLHFPFKVTFHTFRDSSINNKLEYGVPIEEVAGYHGHINIATTYKYYVQIQARKLSRTLINKDPEYLDDQTYTNNTDSMIASIKNQINDRTTVMITKTEVNAYKKRRRIVIFDEI